MPAFRYNRLLTYLRNAALYEQVVYRCFQVAVAEERQPSKLTYPGSSPNICCIFLPLGKSCGASIKTDANITRVTVCNSKQRRTPCYGALSLVTFSTRHSKVWLTDRIRLHTLHLHSTHRVHLAQGLPIPPLARYPGGLPSGSPQTPNNLVQEVLQLKKEIERLKNEYQGFLNNRIEFDTHLHDEQLASRQPDSPRFRDSGMRGTVRAPAPVDSVPPAVDFCVQCDLSQKPASTEVCRCADSTEPLSKFKTTIEVLEAENHHTWHITGLVRELTDSATSIGVVCMSGAQLLDIIKLNQSSPGPGFRCELLIAGTNDLAVGAQRNMYRHLEGFIAARQADAEFIIATLPHRYDLDPVLPVHDETALVNAYIEELAPRYNARVLNLGGGGLAESSSRGTVNISQ
ncbi:hypothetical protein J6590_075211 [Homalodisca vitripennis]|nr:hypothetical protein J6590_075211 [Homalodisca vitripennis]